MLIRKKRKAKEEAEMEEDASRKKAKQEEVEEYQDKLVDLTATAIVRWCKEMDESTDLLWKNMLGDKWEEGKAMAAVERERCQREHREKMARIDENARQRKAREHVSLKDPEVFLDDLDPRY